MKKTIIRILAAAMALAVLAGCGEKANPEKKPEQQSSGQHSVAAPVGEDIHLAKSGRELFDLLSNRNDLEYTEAVPDAMKGEPLNGLNSNNSFGTNVQVIGVDEADAVKTDGKNLYILDDMELKIVSADGADSHELSSTYVTIDNCDYLRGKELFVYNDRVAVLAEGSTYGTLEDRGFYQEFTYVYIFDVSNPMNPVELNNFAQEGNLIDARMIDGEMYTVSVEYKWDPTEDVEQTYLPCLWDTRKPVPVALNRIFVCPAADNYGYTTVSVIDMEAAQRTDTCALTGDTDSIYMDETGLYLAQVVNTDLASEPYQEEQYTVVDRTTAVQTELKRLILEDGALNLTASGTVDGRVLNQYSMDVADGNVRIATSSDSSFYQIYTDEKYDFTNYRRGDSNRSNNLFVLDGSLKQIGAYTGYAQDERIYSVRFLENLAYVVTYRETDPLFAFDLSDPTNPKAISELKVDGVSEYLHMYADGKLLGIGVDEAWKVQAEMFDVSNPSSLKLETALRTDYTYSAVLDNPRAILVDSDHQLIGFPADDEYVILNYDGQNLTKRGSFAVNVFTDSTRGMLLDDTIYICSPACVIAVDANTLEIIADLQFGVG